MYSRKVNFNSHIIYKYNWYSVPTQYINCYIDLKISKKNIDIFYKNDLIATHDLFNDFKRGSYRTKVDHIPNYGTFKPWTLAETLKYAEDVGPNVLKLFNQLINEQKVKEQAILAIVPIIEKSKAYPNNVFEAACKEAIDTYSLPHYKEVVACLNKLVKPEKKKKDNSPNLRGADYYKEN